MKVVGDFEHATTVMGTVAVFRKCEQCGVYKRIGAFPRSKRKIYHVCEVCSDDIRHGLPNRNHGLGSQTRSIVITESGQQLLREIRAEEARELAELRKNQGAA